MRFIEQMTSSAIMLELRERGDVTPAGADVLLERIEQRAKGYTAHADRKYQHGELLDAAMVYLTSAHVSGQVARGELGHFDGAELFAEFAELHWPWDAELLKPRTTREDLVRVAALVLAQLERDDGNTIKFS